MNSSLITRLRIYFFTCKAPGIIDVISYDDVIKAIEDGRLKRMQEHERYIRKRSASPGRYESTRNHSLSADS